MRTPSRNKEDKRNSKKNVTPPDGGNATAGIATPSAIKRRKISTHPAAVNMSMAGVTDEERHQLISEAAYFKAEQRRFAPGNELEDWLTAEKEIEQRLSSLFLGSLPKNS